MFGARTAGFVTDGSLTDTMGSLQASHQWYSVSTVTTEAEAFQEHRRSTRVPLEVSIEVEGEREHSPLKGATVVVNLHGALIRTQQPLHSGSKIQITVYLTGKTAPARVVYVAAENPLHCGIELLQPQNIWGVSLPPEDWEEDLR